MVTCFVRREAQLSLASATATGEMPFDGVAADKGTGGGGEQRVGGNSWALGEPGLEDGSGRRHQRCTPLLAALADGVNVRADAEGDVLAGEAGELGDPQPGLAWISRGRGGHEPWSQSCPPADHQLVDHDRQLSVVLNEGWRLSCSSRNTSGKGALHFELTGCFGGREKRGAPRRRRSARGPARQLGPGTPRW